jgi:hypothetical protein
MVMLITWGLLIVTHWANGEPTTSVTQVVEMTFAVLFIAFLDSQPSTAPVAKGFAWLFLAAVLLRNDSILTALARRFSTTTAKATTPKKAS